MYKNKNKIMLAIIINGIVSIPLAFITLAGIIATISHISGYRETDNIGMDIAVLFFSGFVTWVFLSKCIIAFQAYTIASFFERYSENLVPIDEAAKHMNMKHNRFYNLFFSCLGRKYIINCGIFADDSTFILLDNGEKSIEEKFAIVHCKQCSAPNAIRIGIDNKCKYCESIIDCSEFT